MRSRFGKIVAVIWGVLLFGSVGIQPAQAHILLDWAPKITSTDCFWNNNKLDYIRFDAPTNINDVKWTEVRAGIREAGSDQGILKSVPVKNEIIEWYGNHSNTTYELWFFSTTGETILTKDALVKFNTWRFECHATITRQGTGGRWP